ncbi:MAG: HAMP domain-containing protein, partial [Flavitalea sp.]
MSIQAKTALLFTLVTAGILVFLNLSIYFFTSRLVFNDFFKRLELRAVIASKIKFEQDETSTSTYNELKRQYLESLPQEKEYFLPYDSVTKEINDPYNLNLPGTFYRELIGLQGGTAFIQRGIVKHAGFLYSDQTGQYLVIKSAVNEYGIMVRKDLQLVLLSTFIISILIAFVISWIFSKKTFEPVRKIITRVNDISVHNLHLRLENNKGQDEVAQLADTFNNMLDRLQTSFDTQNNFVSNASHEFRTPLTTIIG